MSIDLSTALRLAPVCVGLVVVAAGAEAAVSEWIENEGGRLRIVAKPTEADGTIRAMVDIDLDPGWKTYWRDPGESGIPPTIAIDGSTNVESAEILFPPPERVDDGYSVWAGYTGPVRLPVVLNVADPDERTVLDASLFLGVCDDVCVPVEADVTMSIGETIEPLHAAMVDQAFADLPAEPDAEFSVEAASLSQDETRLTITVLMPPGSGEDGGAGMFVAAPEDWRLGLPRLIERDGRSATFSIQVKRRPKDMPLSGTPFRVLVTTLVRSMEETVSLP